MPKIVIFYILSLLLTGAVMSRAEDKADLWAQANSAYTTGDYAAAGRLYESLLQRGEISADIYYNLGNAYVQMGNVGDALAAYLRALQLHPNHPQAKNNFKLVLTAVDPNADPSKILNGSFSTPIFTGMPGQIWPWLALAMAVLVVMLYLANQGRQKSGLTKAMCIAAVLGTLSLSLALFAYFGKTINADAVVLHDNTFIYEDANKTKVKWNMPEGTILQRKGKAQKGTLVEVQTHSGFRGWVDAEQLKLL